MSGKGRLEVSAPQRLLPLENGDHLTREEFERRYEARPDLKKAELIEGVVHVPSPVNYLDHGKPQTHLVGWLAVYEAATPGTEAGDNSTVRLDLDNEPQPDAFLRIKPDRGGQSRTSVEGYIEGAPELVAEVAATSASYELHDKLKAHRRNGVREYLVFRALDREVDWFILRGGQYELLSPDARGVSKSSIFPGLWLEVSAFVRGDIASVLAILQEGLASSEHGDFVHSLNRPRE